MNEQEKPFYATCDVNILIPLFPLNVYIAMFLNIVIGLEKYRFSYGRKWGKEKMLNSNINLPITKIDLKKVQKASKRRQKERKRELLYWKDIRAKRLAREIKNRGNSNSNPELARVNKELGLGRKQIVKAEEEYIPKQESKLELSVAEIENIIFEDDLATFEKVAWESMGMTKDEMLREACIYGGSKIAFYLIKAGANVNYRGKYGETPLFFATKNENPKVVKVLMEVRTLINQFWI